MKILKRFSALIFIVTALWLLYVLSFQIELTSLVIFIGCIIITKFCLQNVFIKNRLYLMLSTIIASILISLSLVNEMQTIEKIHQVQSAELWEKFSEKKLTHYINSKNIVLVDITAHWCLTCKVNKFLVLDNKSVIEFLHANHIKLLRADYTSNSPELVQFMAQYGRYGIPLNIIFSSKYKEGIVLPEILSKNDIYKNIIQAIK